MCQQSGEFVGNHTKKPREFFQFIFEETIPLPRGLASLFINFSDDIVLRIQYLGSDYEPKQLCGGRLVNPWSACFKADGSKGFHHLC
jgi:hypothetical protein